MISWHLVFLGAILVLLNTWLAYRSMKRVQVEREV